MKKISNKIKPVLTIMLFISLCIVASTESYQNVTFENKQLKVDFDQDGTYHPYFVQGVVYEPRLSEEQTDESSPENGFLDRDFLLIKEMNANAVYIKRGCEQTDAGSNQSRIDKGTLDIAQRYHLKVIAGFSIGTFEKELEGYDEFNPDHPIDFTKDDTRNEILSRFLIFRLQRY